MAKKIINSHVNKKQADLGVFNDVPDTMLECEKHLKFRSCEQQIFMDAFCLAITHGNMCGDPANPDHKDSSGGGTCLPIIPGNVLIEALLTFSFHQCCVHQVFVNLAILVISFSF